MPKKLIEGHNSERNHQQIALIESIISQDCSWWCGEVAAETKIRICMSKESMIKTGILPKITWEKKVKSMQFCSVIILKLIVCCNSVLANTQLGVGTQSSRTLFGNSKWREKQCLASYSKKNFQGTLQESCVMLDKHRYCIYIVL